MKKIIITFSAVFVFAVVFAYVPNLSRNVPVNPPYKFYKIIKTPTASTLSAEVTHEMDNGWQPTGGVTYVNGEYLQSIMK